MSLYFVLKSFFHLFLNPAMVPDENSMEDPLCNSSFGSMVSLDYVTPDTYLSTLSHHILINTFSPHTYQHFFFLTTYLSTFFFSPFFLTTLSHHFFVISFSPHFCHLFLTTLLSLFLTTFLSTLFSPHFYRHFSHHIFIDTFLTTFLSTLFSPHFYRHFSHHIFIDTFLTTYLSTLFVSHHILITFCFSPHFDHFLFLTTFLSLFLTTFLSLFLTTFLSLFLTTSLQLFLTTFLSTLFSPHFYRHFFHHIFIDTFLSGISLPNFEVLDARIASALNKIIHKSHFKRKISLEEQKAQKEDRFLRGRQIAYLIYEQFRVTGTDDSVENYTDLFTIALQNDDIQEFDSKWDGIFLSKIPHEDILEGLYK